MRVDEHGHTLDPTEVSHRLRLLAQHYGGVHDVLWQAARVFSGRPRQWQRDSDWRLVYLSRYAKIQPSELDGLPVRRLWDLVRQTSKFLEQEAGKSRVVGEGEDG